MDSSARRALALQLLAQAVKAAGKTGKVAVATRLGCGRSYLARVLSPNDDCTLSPGMVDKIIDRYHVIAECPATLQPQPRSECQRLASGKAPTHNPMAMRIWKTCRTCPHQPGAQP